MIDYFHLNMDAEQLLNLSSLGLAHLGDGVYELMVRSWRAERILPLLTQEEADVFRRGRNTAPHSVPKGASRGEYQTATALEALFGWLYLQGRTDRLNQLFSTMMEGEL